MPRNQEREKRPTVGRAGHPNVQKKQIGTYIQGSPRDVCYPGVTQVENVHAGNTAVVATAFLCWVKHGHRISRTGVPADYFINICFEHLLFVCSFRLWGVFRVEESVELISQSYQKRLP